MEDLSGQTILGYKLQECVGYGGYGAVYRAHHAGLDRTVAVKIILPEHATKPNFIERFTAEARIIARLENPHIVPIYDYGQDSSGRVFLVMRWLGSGSLRARLKSGPLKVNAVRLMVEHIADALEAAHQKAVIHRDLKPDNILFDEKNNAFLSDFGIAKDLLSSHRITSTGEGLGTPAYGAPEQMFGLTVTSQTDLYALGMTLYECLTGLYPFGNNNYRHLNTPLPPVSKARAELPPALDIVLQKATAKRAVDRYPDIRSFAEDFQRAFGSATFDTPLPLNAVMISGDREPTPDPDVTNTLLVQTPGVGETYHSEWLNINPDIPYFFISHSATDDETATRIYDDLLRAQVNPWLDHQKIEPGENWDAAIQEALNNCSAALFILTPDSAKSDACAAEREHLLALKKPLYVALAKPVPREDFPWRLRTIEYVDLREGKFADGMAELKSAISEKRPLNLSAGTVVRLYEQEHPGSFKARIFRKAEDVENAQLKPRRMLGRKSLIKRIHKLLDAKDYVLLHGLTGMGKTALAATIAAERVANQTVIWLRAGDANVNMLLEAVASGFDQQQSIAKLPLDERIEKIRALLEEKQGLLVLDDIWDEQALFHFLRAVPRSMPVLITSRKTIYLEGETIEVGELPRNEALQVVRHYARKTFKPLQNELIALCEKLGNHPFALEIAGKRLNAQKELTPRQLLDEIENAPHNLNIPGQFFEAGRGSIRELLDASINRLGIPARTALTMMGGLFTPRVSHELLTLMLAQDAATAQQVPEIIETLEHDGLIGQGVLDDGQTIFYRLHDLTHSYARWMFINEGADHFVVIHAAQQFIKKHLRDYKFIDYEKTNLLEAAKASNSETLVDFMKMLSADGGYLEARGYNRMSLELMEAAIKIAGEQNQVRAHHILLTKLGNYYSTTVSDLKRALALYEAAYREAMAMENIHRQTVLLILISTVYSRMGEKEQAKEFSERAYALATEHNNNLALSQIYEHLGHQELMKENLSEARNNYRLSYDKITDIHNSTPPDSDEQFEIDKRRFYACLNLGTVENEFENYDAALPLHHQALEIGKQYDHLIWLGTASQSIGEAQYGKKVYLEAQHWFEEALTFYCQARFMNYFNALVQFMRENAEHTYLIRSDCLEQGD